MSSNEEIIIYVLLIVFVVGGLCISFVLVNIMDACSAPGERRRQIDLATKREASKEVYQMILEKLFPPNKKSYTTRGKEGDEETSNLELAPCAICIEPINSNDDVMEGIECHHEYHRSCMMEWLNQKHDDCPVCRKSMWTRDAFIEAKKKVFLENPRALEIELAAAAAVEAMIENATETEAAMNVTVAAEAGDLSRTELSENEGDQTNVGGAAEELPGVNENPGDEEESAYVEETTAATVRNKPSTVV